MPADEPPCRSRNISADASRFDLVIFDEASQIPCGMLSSHGGRGKW